MELLCQSLFNLVIAAIALVILLRLYADVIFIQGGSKILEADDLFPLHRSLHWCQWSAHHDFSVLISIPYIPVRGHVKLQIIKKKNLNQVWYCDIMLKVSRYSCIHQSLLPVQFRQFFTISRFLLWTGTVVMKIRCVIRCSPHQVLTVYVGSDTYFYCILPNYILYMNMLKISK